MKNRSNVKPRYLLVGGPGMGLRQVRPLELAKALYEAQWPDEGARFEDLRPIFQDMWVATATKLTKGLTT